MTWRDRLFGIAAGLILGIAIVTAFVFLGSEQTIDAPGVNGEAAGHGAAAPDRTAPPSRKPAPPKAAPVATVRVIGGAPPASGPARLDYRRGQRVRLRVVSDQAVDLELLGYGVSRSAAAGQATPIAFAATKSGNFPLIVTASHIAVAQIRVAGQ
jgi:hypothetical protein